MSRSFTFVPLFVVCLALLVGPVAAQDASGVSVTLYEGNPILSAGEPGTWDSAGIGWPHVILQDGTYHMLYLGWAGDSLPYSAVGYATSEDGLNWVKYDQNPVFTLDQADAPRGILAATPILDGDRWTLYFTGSTAEGRPSSIVLRATASSPTGQWTTDPEPVLGVGSATEWDSGGGISVDSIVQTSDGFAMYYTHLLSPIGVGPAYASGGIGLATSPDGVQWTKYDDPSTTNAKFAISDPILTTTDGAANWDFGSVGIPIVRTADGSWGMYYSGTNYGDWGIGRATSADGTEWEHGSAQLIGRPGHGMAPGSVVVGEEVDYLYYADYSAVTNRFDVMLAVITLPQP